MQANRPAIHGSRAPAVLLLALLACYLPGLLRLPPVDRDEARYAQATRQMLASGDWVEPRFRDQPRDKKPIGIYWLQAAAVRALGSPEAIAGYRVPSLVGALLAVALVARLGRRLFGARVGLLGAALLGTSFTAAAEATLATTDAVLLAAIVVAEGALADLWRGRHHDGPAPLGQAAVFWAALGVGILVKGPVAPAVVALTVLGLCVRRRAPELGWLARLRPALGMLIIAALVAPWALLVFDRSGGEFFRRAWSADVLPKLVSGHEGHGAPPGTYVLVSLAGFFPASLLALPAVLAAGDRRGDDSVRFCLAWLVPAWIAFELVPTKLPHYVLPLYPPLALLCASAVLGQSPRLGARAARIVRAGWALVATTLVVGLAVAALVASAVAALAAGLAAAVIAGTAARALRECTRSRFENAAWTCVGGALLFLPLLLGLVLPGIEPLWLSPRIAAALASAGADRPVSSVGYLEPSLVFLARRDVAPADPAEAARRLAATPAALVLVTDARRAELEACARTAGLDLRATLVAEGWNYSKGRRTRVWLIERSGVAKVPPS